MAITAKIDIKEQDILGALRKFFEDVLNLEDIKAILVPQHLPMKNTVMPPLVNHFNSNLVPLAKDFRLPRIG